ncbi:MAG TPA: MBL fold metallo-hydrolase [Polyangia bacterium]|jgi:hypothetical protein
MMHVLRPIVLACALLVGCAAPAPPPAQPRAPRPPAPPPAAAGPALSIRVFDVGQNDAQLIVAGRRSLLIDLGDESKRGGHAGQVAAEVQRVLGTRHVDYLLVTHHHGDHVGQRGAGIFALLDRERVTVDTLLDRGDAVVAGPPPTTLGPLRAALATWVPRGQVRRYVAARAGTGQIDLGEGVTVEVVAVDSNGLLAERHRADPARYERCPPSENDYSVALKISVGPFEYFTGGDLTGADTERGFGGGCTSYNDVESRVADRVGNVEVMRVNHHGSAHSSNARFVKTLAPEVAIISTGGRYGHPARPVVERLLAGAALFVTGAFSSTTWPEGPPASRAGFGRGFLHQGGDVQVTVAPGGGSYEVGGHRYRSFTDEEEAAGLDRR